MGREERAKGDERLTDRSVWIIYSGVMYYRYRTIFTPTAAGGDFFCGLVDATAAAGLLRAACTVGAAQPTRLVYCPLYSTYIFPSALFIYR